MPGSAAREATLSRMRAEAYLRAARREFDRADRFDLADRTEERVAAQLQAMEVWGWQVLADRRWPGTRSANIDLVAIGPAAVLVMDVKAWSEPRVVGNQLYRGQAAAEDEVDKLLRMTSAVEEIATAVGLAPEHVLPAFVFAGHSLPVTMVGRIHVLGERELPTWVARRPVRIPPEQVETLTAALAEALPPHQAPVPATVPVPTLHPVLPREQPAAAEQLSLVDVSELDAALLAAAMTASTEEWMTFLHPAQAALVRRSFTGPARIRGPAGTGKTVVALHRAAYQAGAGHSPILVTTFVRSLPPVLQGLYRRLSPETAGRVRFVGLHALAAGLLADRHHRVQVDSKAVNRAWSAAWVEVGQRSRLTELVPDPTYWRAEIDRVVKGRGLREFPDYAGLDRVGRKVALHPEQHRPAVWDLYLAYQRNLDRHGLLDFNDQLRQALDEVTRQPPEPRWAAVIVDEVTDLSLLGLRFVHALAAEAPGGLLLVGDGQQAIYPGGYRLREAGIDISGRAVVLDVNYRNRAEITAAARALVPAVLSGDPDDGGTGSGHSRAVQRGGRVERHRFTEPGAHDRSLVQSLWEAIRRRKGPADIAVLCRTLDDVTRCQRLLRAQGIPVVALADYAGVAQAAVKIGTYKRAKGLDFPVVFLPRLRPVRIGRGSGDEERAELWARELHVAATRARDELWIGHLDERAKS